MANMISSTPINKSKPSKRARIGSNTCPKCDITIEHQQNLACCVCELSFCIQCTKISPKLAEALKEDESNNFKWTCNVCKQNFPCMSSLSTRLKTIEENTQTRLTLMEEKMTEINLDIGKKVKKEFTLIKPTLIEEIKMEIKASLHIEARESS